MMTPASVPTPSRSVAEEVAAASACAGPAERSPDGPPAPTDRIARVELLACVTAAAFAGAALMSQTAVVPEWRALTPATFLQRFSISGPATGTTAFVFELAAMALIVTATARAYASRRAGRTVWALSTACMGGTFVVLVYFVPTNLALLHHAVAPGAVPATLTIWNRWNWLRTGLGLAAAASSVVAAVMRPGTYEGGR